MNAKQKALYDRVVAAGQLWVGTEIEYRHQGPSVRRAPTGDATTLSSMVEPVGIFAHTPGGYRREIVLKIIEHRKLDRYFTDGKTYQIHSESWLVEPIAAEC